VKVKKSFANVMAAKTPPIPTNVPRIKRFYYLANRSPLPFKYEDPIGIATVLVKAMTGKPRERTEVVEMYDL